MESEYFKVGGRSFARGLLSLDDRLSPDNFLPIYKQFYNRGYQHPHKPKRICGGNDDDDDDDDVTETSSRESKLSIKGVYRHPFFVRHHCELFDHKSLEDFQTAATTMATTTTRTTSTTTTAFVTQAPRGGVADLYFRSNQHRY